jgi:hypothetical protein
MVLIFGFKIGRCYIYNMIEDKYRHNGYIIFNVMKRNERRSHGSLLI